MSDVDLGPVLLQQFKAVAPYIGRDDMLLLSGDDHSLAFFTEDARTWVHDATFRRCPAGHRHEVIARVFGVPFCVCPMAAEGQVWVLRRQEGYVSVEILDIVKAIRSYERRFGDKPPSLYISRGGRASLWDGFANAPGVGDAPEPPLHVPIYVEGVPVWALHGVEEGSVTAIIELPGMPRERGAL